MKKVMCCNFCVICFTLLADSYLLPSELKEMVCAPLQSLSWMRMQSIAAESGPAHCLGHPSSAGADLRPNSVSAPSSDAYRPGLDQACQRCYQFWL